ncbi:MAG TPA: helix-turn-helix domain-containing protein [Solirubrobacteraceae bacterium]
MAAQERIPLLEARPELEQHLTPEQLGEIARFWLPVVTLDHSQLELRALLASHNAFGATVLEGVVMNSLRTGEHTGIQLLGPGDLLFGSADLLPSWLSEFETRTADAVRLGLFANELLAAVFRWPRIIQSLCACIGEQLQRLTAQLVICQLPRVDDRVLSMLWLLSESWGHVTPSGVRLPLVLTHETLGALVGARRPTVTLALRKLIEQGAIVHQDTGWLLLEAPAEPADTPEKILPPEVADTSTGLWGAEMSAAERSVAYAELRATVSHLREQHQFQRQAARDQLRRMQSARVRMSAARERIAEDALRRRRPPSS